MQMLLQFTLRLENRRKLQNNDNQQLQRYLFIKHVIMGVEHLAMFQNM